MALSSAAAATPAFRPGAAVPEAPTSRGSGRILVVDDELRSRLPGYVLGEIIGVEFQYGGNDGKKYPKAINVSLSDDDLGEDSYYDDYDSEGYD